MLFRSYMGQGNWSNVEQYEVAVSNQSSNETLVEEHKQELEKSQEVTISLDSIKKKNATSQTI